MNHVERLSTAIKDIKSVINVYVDDALPEDCKLDLTMEIVSFVEDIIEDVYSEGYNDGYEVCDKELGE